ncbi:MAG: TonB-dependent receptor [Acidobacteria bacterium]|nr:TonB-dependent receptor [Acidobacteriota bacterium]
MTKLRKPQGALLLMLVLCASSAGAGARGEGGGLLGWVEDTQGMPVAGAVISLFGKGIGNRGLVTLSDSAGRFFLPSLPAGSYTLRALGQGHVPAPARRITILPNQDSVFSVSLTPIRDLSEEEVEERTAELRWLLRHRSRSVLEQASPVTVPAREERAPGASRALGATGLADLDGSLEVVANPAAFGVDDGSLADDLPASFSVVKLRGRVAGLGQWSLGGLVAEAESATWRMAAEFTAEPWAGHSLQAGAGYGSRLVRPALPGVGDPHGDDRGVGAILVNDHWKAGDVSGSFGARYSYIGYLQDANHVDPSAALEVRREDGTAFRGSVAARTLMPGGDLLTLSSLATGPAIAFAHLEPGMRPERTVRWELAVDRSFGPTTVAAHTFYEGVRDQIVNAFEGPGASRSLRIFNGGAVAARGVGLTVSRRFGSVLTGAVTYTYGRSWRGAPAAPGDEGAVLLTFREGDFHDVVGRLETAIDRSGTRLLAYYRVNALDPDDDPTRVRSSRFDVQVRQGLPLIGTLTRSEWELLLAYRNLFYEASEGATLDELVVANPPKRVLGGIAVRF